VGSNATVFVDLTIIIVVIVTTTTIWSMNLDIVNIILHPSRGEGQKFYTHICEPTSEYGTSALEAPYLALRYDTRHSGA